MVRSTPCPFGPHPKPFHIYAPELQTTPPPKPEILNPIPTTTPQGGGKGGNTKPKTHNPPPQHNTPQEGEERRREGGLYHREGEGAKQGRVGNTAQYL